jgi:arylformamidase
MVSGCVASDFMKPENLIGTCVTATNLGNVLTYLEGVKEIRQRLYISMVDWQTLSKEDFSFVAQGPLELGYNVVLAEYTLAPQSSMTQIVQEIGRLLNHLVANRWLIGSGPVCLAGHSAGAHLGLVHRSHPLLSHTMAISPLVDLEPIRLSWLNERLNLDANEVEQYSPLRHIGIGTPMTIAVGAAELPELVRHASEYAAEAAKFGNVDYVAIDTRNHFTVLEDLASATGVLTKKLRDSLSQYQRRTVEGRQVNDLGLEAT